MRIKFDGQTHSIDANTLINVLTRYQTVVNEANRQLGNGDREINLKINALEKGSFIIDFTLEQNIFKQLFSNDSVNYIASLVTIIGGVYGYYKVLHGKPTTKATAEERNLIRNVTISGDRNNVTITNNVYNTAAVREAISKSIEESDADSSVEGLSMQDDDGVDYARFERDDFKSYIYDDFDNEEEIPDERIQDKDVTLVIVGLSFESGSRWYFMYEGFKIQMIVKDDALMKRIDGGERFGKGDAIRVKMRIVQRYNKLYKAYENKSYKIMEFYEHIIPPEPLYLFGEESKE